jgi:hypothetical protein
LSKNTGLAGIRITYRVQSSLAPPRCCVELAGEGAAMEGLAGYVNGFGMSR